MRKHVAGNPIVKDKGLTDPHIVIHEDRAYLFATHDFSQENNGFLMKDWWVWSSRDMVNWEHESTLRPEDTYLRKPFDDCWATFGVFRNGKCYWYFSAGPNDIGVVVADSAAGPWKDPLGKALLPAGLTTTDQRDPDVFFDDDGTAYLVFGTFDYFLVRLNDDMISLAEKPHPIALDRNFGPYGEGKTDDKPSLHKRNGIYYLSWSSYYAMSDNVYGPYTFKGSVIAPEGVAPELRNIPTATYGKDATIWHDRHGNFFTWHNQWYYTCNDKSLPGRTDFFRDAFLSHVHYRDNGEMAPIQLNELGVGHYDASQGRIEAEDYFNAVNANKRQCPEGGFEIRDIRQGSCLVYPNVMNLPGDSLVSFRVACENPAGATIEVRANREQGPVLGRCQVPCTGGWTSYQTVECQLRNKPEKIDIYLVFDGQGDELLRLDWLSFGSRPVD